MSRIRYVSRHYVFGSLVALLLVAPRTTSAGTANWTGFMLSTRPPLGGKLR